MFFFCPLTVDVALCWCFGCWMLKDSQWSMFRSRPDLFRLAVLCNAALSSFMRMFGDDNGPYQCLMLECGAVMVGELRSLYLACNFLCHSSEIALLWGRQSMKWVTINAMNRYLSRALALQLRDRPWVVAYIHRCINFAVKSPAIVISVASKISKVSPTTIFGRTDAIFAIKEDITHQSKHSRILRCSCDNWCKNSA